MRFKKLYMTLFFSLASTLAGYAQEEQTSGSAIRGELNFLYSHILAGKQIGLGGFGSDFHSVLTPVGRFLNDVENEIWAKQPLFNLGLEGNLILKSLYQSDAITLSPILSYSLRYSHERYRIAYDPDMIHPENPIPVGQLGGPGSVEDIQLHSLINQLSFGVRMEHGESAFYSQLSLGVLFYTPLSLKWKRQAYDAQGNPTVDATHSVGLGESLLVSGSTDSHEAGVHILSLRGTSEFLASIGARIGYGPVFVGINYATNMRVNVVSFDIGLTLYPVARSNS
ncbi:hypothetical protein [Entomospira culicis]|uniref:MetA-pathway of phenol degradation n=1 Tax=Entomospira culicis TaxID=2719989 RepID=A0A968GHP3_9SPIO|nr:hypothetical protein [Entomospira culicis]NIZ18620.1 hypothetical protein [Entomospira culicis]NIZ68835.1 hypothetical protein [Entomospira culicis]WDI37429.1 hypothetical protein PVA46_01175 [Entomospira culicis]WDI39057.1 hypothetical protein PVA47_01180 [Entomospira culicis]